MSQSFPTSSSSSNFHSVFNAAFKAYENKTKNKLLTHPLATQLQSCHSPTAVLSVLQDLIQRFDNHRGSDERLRNWLNPTVNVLYSFSATLGEGVGLVFSPAKVIFAGIGVLLLAAKDVDASQDMLIDIFERIEGFFKRLESYTELPPSDAMTDMMVKILTEVLSILAITTTEIQQRRRKKYINKLLGRNDVEDALKRLDKFTQEEARMATAELLKVTRSVDNKVEVVIDAGETIQRTADETKETMHETASDVNRVKRNQFRQDLRRWLSPPDPSTNHNIARQSHFEGTATWFFEGDTYKEWKSAASLLWIYGKPGSGKSILCSGIIEEIIPLRETGAAFLAYFYCDFRDKEKQGRRDLLLSIISQLVAQSNVFCDVLSRLYSTHDDGERKPSDNALTECLKEILLSPAQVPIYLIVDALDECPNNSGMPTPREVVLDLVEDLVSLHLHNLHICVTSRSEIDIRTVLEPLAPHRVALHDQSGQRHDIISYVSSMVHSDKKMRRWREEDKNLVIETLSERADGMFRWVFCQLETLRHCLPPSVRGILDGLPETLDETYARILTDINKANREHARRLLHCLTVAIRPLRVEELAEVLAVDFNAESQGLIPTVNLDWRWADQRQAILSTCSSLIAIIDDGESQVVQFSHFSVKEFLTSKRLAGSHEDISHYHILLEPAHAILTWACLGVLFRLDERVDKVDAKGIPLAEYAARHWADHAKFEGVASRLQDTMEYFFDADKPHWAAWLRVHNIDTPWVWTTLNSRVPEASPLYYATLCGFLDLTKYLIIKYPELINARGGHRATPLVAALVEKHFQVAELLHQHGADVNLQDAKERTALHGASLEGLIDVTLWLLNHGADVNAQKWDNWSSLHLAAYHGRLEIVQILLDHNAGINARNKNGRTALFLATRHCDDPDRINVIRLLLDRGADVEARDKEGSTPLHMSAAHGRFEAARILLEHNTDINPRNEDGGTALHIAARYCSQPGRINVMQLLLDHGADVNALDGQGLTPLYVAADYGNVEAIRMLLEYNADLNARNGDGRTALHNKVRCCHQPAGINVMQLLLDHGADVNTRDSQDVTPLHEAADYRLVEAIRMLLEHNADLNARNGDGRTALHITVRYCHQPDGINVMQSLLDHGADVNTRDSRDLTPLHEAADYRLVEVIRMLLEHNADLNARNGDGRTALHIAVRYCHQPVGINVMQLLLDHGADINTRDSQDLTPLHDAAKFGLVEAIRMLLEHNADLNAQNGDERTALHIAVQYCHQLVGINVMQLLLDHGADVNTRDSQDLTPLHEATDYGLVEAIRMLLEHNADLNARNGDGRTALHIAARYCYQPDWINVMQLLLDYGADINARDNEGSTPLHLSSRLKTLLSTTMRTIEGTRLLIRHGASIDAENNKGETARQVALATGFYEMAELLAYATQ